MKIVNLDTFIALPSGTLFAKYEPCVFGPLSVKHDSLPETKDFFYQDLIDCVDCNGSDEMFSVLESAEHYGTSFTLDYELIGRNGMYEPTQLFAVFEPNDVAKFKAFINSLP